MKITVLKSNRTLSYPDVKSLKDVNAHVFPSDCSLESLMQPSLENWIPVDNLKSVFWDNISFDDVLDDKDIESANGGFVHVVFQVKKETNKYVLYANKSKTIEFEFDDDKPTSKNLSYAIPGNLLNADYEIHGKFYQCIHRTKDFLEVVAKKMAKDKNKEWEDYYGEALKEAMTKVPDRWIDEYDLNPLKGAKFQYEKWYGIKDNKERKDKANKNVEFKNFRYFVEGVRNDFNSEYGATNRFNAADTAIDVCKKIQGYRNDGSHSVYSLVYAEGESSINEALNKLITLIDMLNNSELSIEIGKVKSEISTLFKGKPNDLSINNH